MISCFSTCGSPETPAVLSRIFAEPIRTGRSLVIEMGIAVYSAGEVSHDLRFIYMPAAEGADVSRILKAVRKTQCCSNEIVQLRAVHSFSVDAPCCALPPKP